jgi:hypothetical protein
MSGRLHGLQKRMARVEQMLAHVAIAEELRKCICVKFTSVTANEHELDEFESEMNRTCPVHGFRRLGVITTISCRESEEYARDNARLDQLLAEYEARQLPAKSRLSQLRWVARKIKHDYEER